MAKVATLGRKGAPELFGEGLERGSRCNVDLSQVDHLALAELPLDQVREQCHVVPLAHPWSEQVHRLVGEVEPFLRVGLRRLSIKDDGLCLEEGQEAVPTALAPDP